MRSLIALLFLLVWFIACSNDANQSSEEGADKKDSLNSEKALPANSGSKKPPPNDPKTAQETEARREASGQLFSVMDRFFQRPINFSTAEEKQLLITPRQLTEPSLDMSFAIESLPMHGTLIFNQTGPVFQYNPNVDFNGEDSFRVRIFSKEFGHKTVAIVAVKVEPANDAPVATALNLNIKEDSSGEFHLIATDKDSPSLTFTVLEQPKFGTISQFDSSNGKFTYTPAPDATGKDFFLWSVTDGASDPISARVDLNLDEINDAPVARDGSASVDEDNSSQIDLKTYVSDPDSTGLRYDIVTAPRHGSLIAVQDGVYRYTPNPNFSGTDVFEYEAFDGQLTSGRSTFHLTIAPVNDAPEIRGLIRVNDMSFTLLTNNGTHNIIEDIISDYNVVSDDIDLELVTVQVDAAGSKGRVLVYNHSIKYIPQKNYVGPDSFKVRVADGHGIYSEYMEINLSLSEDNIDPPVASAVTINMSEDTTKDYLLEQFVSDPDGQPLTFTAKTLELPKGTLTISETGNLTFVAKQDVSGLVDTSYEVTDSTQRRASGSLRINIDNVNDAPVPQEQAFSVNEDVVLINQLNVDDVDNNVFIFEIVPGKGPENGSLTIERNTGTFTFTPTENFNGIDRFTYQVGDGALSAQKTVTITVSPQPDNPTLAVTKHQSTLEDTALNISFSSGDPDGDPTIVEIVRSPTGTVVLHSASIAYTPAPNMFGRDSFLVRSCEPTGACSPTKEIIVSVTAVNDPILAYDAVYVASEDSTVQCQMLYRDLDNNQLTFSLTKLPTNGSVTFFNRSTGGCLYNPKFNASGIDSFKFRVSDGNSTAEATVRIQILEKVDPISFTGPTSFSVPEDESILIPIQFIDSDRTPINFTISPYPNTNAILTRNDNGQHEALITPYKNHNGRVGFAVVADQQGSTVSHYYLVDVNPVNDRPVADDSTFFYTWSGNFSTVAKCKDIDVGDSLSYSVAKQPSFGTVSFLGSTFTYVPSDLNAKEDSFEFKCTDVEGLESVGKIELKYYVEFHIVGQYRMTGNATSTGVSIGTGVPVILGLSSYEKVNWRVTQGDYGSNYAVTAYLNSYTKSSVTGTRNWPVAYYCQTNCDAKTIAYGYSLDPMTVDATGFVREFENRVGFQAKSLTDANGRRNVRVTNTFEHDIENIEIILVHDYTGSVGGPREIILERPGNYIFVLSSVADHNTAWSIIDRTSFRHGNVVKVALSSNNYSVGWIAPHKVFQRHLPFSYEEGDAANVALRKFAQEFAGTQSITEYRLKSGQSELEIRSDSCSATQKFELEDCTGNVPFAVQATTRTQCVESASGQIFWSAACEVDKCQEGYSSNGKSCMPSICTPGDELVESCTIVGASAASRKTTCNASGGYQNIGGCFASACNSGFTLEGGKCIANRCNHGDNFGQVSCRSQIANATLAFREISCDENGVYTEGPCSLHACQDGYFKHSSGQCVAIMCEADSQTVASCTNLIANSLVAEKVVSCNRIGTVETTGTCELRTCRAGYTKQGNSCVLQSSTGGGGGSSGGLGNVCSTNSGCQSSYTCINSRCSHRSIIGLPCDDVSDCSTVGANCTQGICSNVSGGQTGDRCAPSVPCALGWTCFPSPIGYCIRY